METKFLVIYIWNTYGNLVQWLRSRQLVMGVGMLRGVADRMIVLELY